MRFSIAPEGDNELPVVASLPAEQVGRLEGYNGIGKTLAATVLQICTGTQPFLTADQQARWEGLRDGLGQMTVTAEGLRDGRSLRWRLDSRLWPVDVTKALEVTDEWFEIELDGQPATLAETRALLRVERIAGNEGLLETIAEEADTERGKIEAFIARTSARQDALERTIGSLATFLRPVEPGAYEAQALRAHKEKAVVEEALVTLTEANDRVRDLQDVIELRDQLAELQVAGPGLDQHAAALVDQIAERQHDSARILEEIKALSPSAARTADAAKSLSAANSALKRANTRLNNASETLSSTAAVAGLEDVELAETALEVCRAELDDTQDRRKALTSRPELLDLLGSFDGPLRLAQNQDLGRQIVMVDPLTPDRQWTIDEVYEALGKQREALVGAPTLPAVESVERETASLEQRFKALSQIPRLRDALEGAQRGMRTATARVRQLNEDAENPASGKIQELEWSLEKLNAALLPLGAEQARVDRRRADLASGRTPEEVGLALARRLERLSLEPQVLEAARDDALDSADRAQEAYRVADEHSRREASQLASMTEQMNRLIIGLHDRPELEWLTRQGGVPIPAPGEGFDAKRAGLERLAAAVRDADDRLGLQRARPLSVSFALEALARELRGARKDGTPELMGVMRNWLEHRAAAWFDTESVRRFVLPEVAGSVMVDLQTRTVFGHQANGSPVSKPLEGFSSGEQAFAFTQAQLALLDHRRSQSTAQLLVILDEFGAFIAARGRQQLAAQLHQWAKAHPFDQVLVILPTTQDYEALARSASQDLRPRLMQYASDLSEREYFIGPFEDR